MGDPPLKASPACAATTARHRRRRVMANAEPPLLSVEGVSFAHDPAEPKQLDGVSFVLRRGRTLGILGANECGKTTLGQLLLGRLAPGAGRSG